MKPLDQIEPSVEHIHSFIYDKEPNKKRCIECGKVESINKPDEPAVEEITMTEHDFDILHRTIEQTILAQMREEIKRLRRKQPEIPYDTDIAEVSGYNQAIQDVLNILGDKEVIKEGLK